jgi:hypothetical protein
LTAPICAPFRFASEDDQNPPASMMPSLNSALEVESVSITTSVSTPPTRRRME